MSRIPTQRSEIIAAAIAAARSAGWDEDAARGYAVSELMKFNPAMGTLFARGIVGRWCDQSPEPETSRFNGDAGRSGEFESSSSSP